MLKKPNHPNPNRINDIHLRRWDGQKYKCIFKKSMLRSEWYNLQDRYETLWHTSYDDIGDLPITWHYPEECDIPDRRIHLRRTP